MRTSIARPHVNPLVQGYHIAYSIDTSYYCHMVYEYFCCECGRTDELVFPITFDREVRCTCGKEMQRLISLGYFTGATPDSRTYNPAFGKMLNKAETKLEAKRRGMVEVGNEDLNKIKKQEKTHEDYKTAWEKREKLILNG